MLHGSRLTPTRDTLKHETCAAEFPAQCAAALERVSALIVQQAAHEPPLRLSRNLEDFREAQEPTPVRLLRARRLLIRAAEEGRARHDRTYCAHLAQAGRDNAELRSCVGPPTKAGAAPGLSCSLARAPRQRRASQTKLSGHAEAPPH